MDYLPKDYQPTLFNSHLGTAFTIHQTTNLRSLVTHVCLADSDGWRTLCPQGHVGDKVHERRPSRVTCRSCIQLSVVRTVHWMRKDGFSSNIDCAEEADPYLDWLLDHGMDEKRSIVAFAVRRPEFW